MTGLKNGLFLKLQVLLGVIGAVCLAMGLFIWTSEQDEQRLDAISEGIMKKTAIIEKVNGLVYAVVMESRGLYMAETPAQIERFGKGLEGHLSTLKITIGEWEKRVEASDRAKFDTFKVQADQFIKLRTELVAEARTKGAAGARAVGDNEANRSVRTAFNKSVEALVDEYKRHGDEVEKENEQKHFYASLKTRSALFLIFALVVGGWIWISRAITRPFAQITGALGELAAGNHAVEVQGRERPDEIGAIAKAIDAFCRASIEREQMAAQQSEEDRKRIQRQNAMETAISRFEEAAGSRVQFVAKTSNDLHIAAASMSTGAEETARQAEIVSEASQEMTSNIETLATAGDQLAGAIAEIANRMVEASHTAELAANRSEETTEKFAELAQAVAKIGDVVNLINQIAAQTNLLALNATIEAARAGEAGRGFAVVASEVKQLAAQTTRATAEIAESVTRVQTVATESIDAVRGISATIQDMRGISTAVAAAVEEQRVSTQEIAANVQNSAQGTEQVASNIVGVSQAAAETGDAAMKVLQSASRLSEEASAIQLDVQQFLEQIRAA